MKKILVVDDYLDTLKIMRVFLNMYGYEVVEATNGKQAIERAVSEQPDIILMDISLPVIDGIEATKILKSKEETKQNLYNYRYSEAIRYANWDFNMRSRHIYHIHL